jgi:glycosyltransferase involved in cell wall biosynthesis
MRVGLLAHAARAGDAIGRQIAAKVAFFRERGDDVRVVVATDRGLDPVLRPFHERYSPQASDSILAWLRQSDLILVEYSQYSPVFDAIALVAGGRSKIIFDYHGVTPPALGGASHRDALVRGAESRKLCWFADTAIAHSGFAAKELLDSTHFPNDRTHRLGYPIDSDGLTTVAPASKLRQQLGIVSDARLLLFVGRLAPNKRAPVLVEALTHLADDVHAVFVGDCSDCYETERQRCRERAARHRVSDRVHFLGSVDEKTLRDAYREADVFVMPSIHEGFCWPVIEAMASGLPVVAARATALPETLGDAGLTFTADDPADLARQVERVLNCGNPVRSRAGRARRIAVVAPRFGDGFAGGAETSLQLLAGRMKLTGDAVEVFTIGEHDGTSTVGGLPVHRFRADPVDADRRGAAAHAITLANGIVDADTESEWIENTLRSNGLIDGIQERGPFDAIIVGPYPTRLALDVAAAFHDRTVLMPCWHDEPIARLPIFRKIYGNVAGVLYHSPEEQQFAQTVLGLNLPNASVIGTLIDATTPGDAPTGRKIVATGRRYLLFAGRYCREKGLDRLIGYARRYASDHPNRFTLAFIGGGDEQIPDEPWSRDLGYVTDDVRRDVMAGADALVLLSAHESLSLVVLEAQACGIPVIVEAGNAVLEGHLRRGAGGVAVGDYEAFAAALDDLWNDQQHWRNLGHNGQAYVASHFTDAVAFDRAWQTVLSRLNEPLAQQMRENGFRRAAEFTTASWRDKFGKLIDSVMEQPSRAAERRIELRPRTGAVTVAGSASETLIPMRITARGGLPIASDGPTRCEIKAQVLDEAGRRCGRPTITPLPGILLPDQTVAAIARVRIPSEPGDYSASITAQSLCGLALDCSTVELPLTVSGACAIDTEILQLPERLRANYLAAESAQQLPDGYVDVSLGRLARLKRWLKSKLLHNFRTAYVDVLSRQQSAFNRHLLNTIAELCDAQAELAHALTTQSSALDLRELRRRERQLQQQVARLNSSIPARAQESAA